AECIGDFTGGAYHDIETEARHLVGGAAALGHDVHVTDLRITLRERNKESGIEREFLVVLELVSYAGGDLGSRFSGRGSEGLDRSMLGFLQAQMAYVADEYGAAGRQAVRERRVEHR